MFNQVVLVGKLEEIKEESLIVRSCGKENEEDLITMFCSEKMLNNVREYSKIGSVIGIKGHLKSNGVYVDKVSII